ncbi:MAG: LPS export ABC transporter permease LptF [Deltaproteobacteria bacterium]|nr:LPS export ABC transporter permease LptF [Deltaproteobacteria bacterium]
MPRTINIYILKEITVPFILSLSILTVTALLSKIIKLIDLMVTQGAGIPFVFWFVLSIIPSFLIYTIPISFLIGVLVAFTRLSSDSEITAMKASGLSLFAIMKPVVFLALVVYALSLSVTLYFFPWGNINMKKLLFDAARTKLISGIDEKTFYDRFKGVVLYVDRLNQKTGEMEGIFISQHESAGGKARAFAESTIFFAHTGAFSPSEDKSILYFKLFDGTIHRKGTDNGSYHLADFSSYVLELNLSGGEQLLSYMDKPNREMYLGELMDKVRLVGSRGEKTAPYLIDLHKRFALPASVFVFTILGAPLGIQKVRAARFTGFSVSLSVVLAYYVVSTAMEAMGNNGLINPVLSVWGSDIIFGAAGLCFFYMAARDRPVNIASVIREAVSLLTRQRKSA